MIFYSLQPIPMLDNIQAEYVEVGKGAVVHGSIRGLNGRAKRVVIGDNTYIGADVQIICDDFAIGDYGKIQHHTNIHGHKVHIGHNAWIGQYTIIDGLGGTVIGDNCGIGAHSQLWSHVKYGDVLAGCRFNSTKPLTVGKDVWFVGHCIVGPISAADRSMALAGSVVTKDMERNRVYAGTPARELGFNQFDERSPDAVLDGMRNLFAAFGYCPGIAIARSPEQYRPDGRTWFFTDTRTYTKRGTDAEVAFMRYLLPEKAKFTPEKENLIMR
jgi:acetyltransferase-like isoleucine patch superfamily enzyme